MTTTPNKHLCIRADVCIGKIKGKNIIAQIKNQYVIVHMDLIFKKKNKVSSVNDLIFLNYAGDPECESFEMTLLAGTKILLGNLELNMCKDEVVNIIDARFDPSNMKLYNSDGTPYENYYENVLDVIDPDYYFYKKGLKFD